MTKTGETTQVRAIAAPEAGSLLRSIPRAALAALQSALAELPQNSHAWTYTIRGFDNAPYLTRTLLPRINSLTHDTFHRISYVAPDTWSEPVVIRDAIIRTITRWLPTLDEARLREVEDFVLAKAIEQQDSARPAASEAPGCLVVNSGERATRSAEDVTGTTPEQSTAVAAPRKAAGIDARSGFDTLPPLDSAPADTVVHRDGERTHGGNLSWQPGNCPACYATIGVDPDGTIADHDHPDRGWAEIGCPGSGHPPLTEPEKRAVVEHYDRIESGLRELRDTPPDLNSAEMWRAEVDGKFDDGGES